MAGGAGASYVSFDGDQARFVALDLRAWEATVRPTFEQFCGSISVTWRALVAAAWLAPGLACLCKLPAASLLACSCCCSASAGYAMLGERGLPRQFGAHQLHCRACGHHRRHFAVRDFCLPPTLEVVLYRFASFASSPPPREWVAPSVAFIFIQMPFMSCKLCCIHPQPLLLLDYTQAFTARVARNPPRHARVALGHAAFNAHRKQLFQNHCVSPQRRRELFMTLVTSKIIYGTESWVLMDKAAKSYFHGAIIRLYRRMLGVGPDVHLTDGAIIAEVELPSPHDFVAHCWSLIPWLPISLQLCHPLARSAE
eukprot:s638_g9.t1